MIPAKLWRGIVLLALAAGIVGCGTPGPPQPPSLNLPDRVQDLHAERTGSQVALSWTMPKRSTDRLILKGSVVVHICRQEAPGSCSATADLNLAPDTAGTYIDSLPPALSSGQPRPLSYFVELKNRNGRSAGLSNAAVVLAGQAPAQITGFSAEVQKSGVVLHWTSTESATAVRLERKLLTPHAGPKHETLLAAPAEPVEQNLLVDSDAGKALDKAITFGNTYEYRAQRVARIEADGSTFELAGELSDPVQVQALDIFPPAVPSGLAAVATASENGSPASIDLNWQPNTEPDVAGYFVYRREGEAAWRRISGDQPIAAPAFHDSEAMAGHTYQYSVSATDKGGHESSRSAEAEETVPNP